MEELDQVFAGEGFGFTRGRVLVNEVEILNRGALFERSVDQSLQVPVVTGEISGRFGNRFGRIGKGK
jgi:hypothetical protein